MKRYQTERTDRWSLPAYYENGRVFVYYRKAYRRVFYTRNDVPFVYYFEFKVSCLTGKYFS